MAERLKLKQPIVERPASEWSTIAVELLGTQSRIIQGERWYHHVIEKGDGPPLFLYHGVGGHAETYARTLPQLAKNFHVYAVDALFHGYSSKEPSDTGSRADQQVDAVVDLAHALGYDKIHYEGESMGAAMGVNFGFRYPEMVDRMVLNGFPWLDTVETFKVNPSRGNLEELSHAAILDPTYENIRRRLEWLVAEPERIDDEMVFLRQRLYNDPEIAASLRKVFGVDGPRTMMTNKPYVEADFAKFEPGPRTLVLWGEWNPMRGYDFGEHCADLIGAKFYGVDDAGHWPQWEHPDEYVQVLTEFLLDG